MAVKARQVREVLLAGATDLGDPRSARVSLRKPLILFYLKSLYNLIYLDVLRRYEDDSEEAGKAETRLNDENMLPVAVHHGDGGHLVADGHSQRTTQQHHGHPDRLAARRGAERVDKHGHIDLMNHLVEATEETSKLLQAVVFCLRGYKQAKRVSKVTNCQNLLVLPLIEYDCRQDRAEDEAPKHH